VDASELTAQPHWVACPAVLSPAAADVVRLAVTKTLQ
jgi:hypothetical protein